MKTKKFLVLALLTIFTLIVSACAPAAGGLPAAAPATGGTEAAAASGDEFSTPNPILSDLKVRTAIANCIDRDALIASVYPYVDDKGALTMDSNLPKTHWAYKGPYDFPKFDPAAGKALLDEAGWTQAEGDPVRTKDGQQLSLKFTTTNAQFRQTWSQVAIQQLADCGIQVIPTYAPASWWFGDTTGLARRDFELGAYAWVGEADPKGRTLYACNQIPLPSNNWEGQNYMGWCNDVANTAIVRANNTLNRDERITAYDTFQKEFAKDVVSIPLFQRAEAEAWSTNLEKPAVDPTEYATANLQTWKLTDGGDTIVLGMSQEPDTMWTLVASAASQRLVSSALGTTATQFNYDYQPTLMEQLSTIENGLSTNATVEPKAGDMVYDSSGNAVALEKGVKVFDSEGNEVEYDGTTPIKMLQLTTTYKLKPYTWSDGTPGSVEDMKLGYTIDCDKESGAVSFEVCNQIQEVTYGDGLEMTFKWLPGSQYSLYFLYQFAIYPSHQVLSDGRNLKDVPAAEWATLPEIAEKPLSYGAYMIKDWTKGQSITLEKNPYYDGEVATPNVVYVYVADSQQAVAQLLNGDVDWVEKSTLGAGAEVQTVIDAVKGGAPIAYEISPSPTWEHIDINMFQK